MMQEHQEDSADAHSHDAERLKWPIPPFITGVVLALLILAIMSWLGDL